MSLIAGLIAELETGSEAWTEIEADTLQAFQRQTELGNKFDILSREMQ